eukprot:2196805-Rhodomonas_salina.4
MDDGGAGKSTKGASTGSAKGGSMLKPFLVSSWRVIMAWCMLRPAQHSFRSPARVLISVVRAAPASPASPAAPAAPAAPAPAPAPAAIMETRVLCCPALTRRQMLQRPSPSPRSPCPPRKRRYSTRIPGSGLARTEVVLMILHCIMRSVRAAISATHLKLCRFQVEANNPTGSSYPPTLPPYASATRWPVLMRVIKSDSDPREYRYFELDNGLQ